MRVFYLKDLAAGDNFIACSGLYFYDFYFPTDDVYFCADHQKQLYVSGEERLKCQDVGTSILRPILTDSLATCNSPTLLQTSHYALALSS
jgi:hypothetical protein